MEAANKGAASVPGAITAGIAISLPFEAGLNKYVTPELAMQMHYFFTRKFALCWPSEWWSWWRDTMPPSVAMRDTAWCWRQVAAARCQVPRPLSGCCHFLPLPL